MSRTQDLALQEIQAIRRLEDPAARAERTAAFLHDPHPILRLNAVLVSRALPRPELLDDLIPLARDPDPGVRTQVAVALGAYAQLPELEPARRREILRALAGMLDDEGYDSPHDVRPPSVLPVQRYAHGQLRSATGQDLPMDREAWLGWLEAEEAGDQ